MALPKITHPILTFTIPTTKKACTFRPFTVKEEKLLLFAKTSGKTEDILPVINQVVSNCSLDNLDVKELAMADIEYLFLKLYSASVSNMLLTIFIDRQDEKEYRFEVDLEQIEVTMPEKVENTIKISPEMALTLKYPRAGLFEDQNFLKTGSDEAFYELILKCLDKLYDKDSVFDLSTTPRAELEEWLETLPRKVFKEIRKFLTNVPKLEHSITYTNSVGNERTIRFDSLRDFFIFFYQEEL